MAIQLQQLAELVGGRIVGDASVSCAGANPPDVATPDDITMLDDPSRVDVIATSQAVAVVTSEPIDQVDIVQLVVEDPHAAFSAIVAHFRPPMSVNIPGVGVDSSAQIAASASIHPTATIGAGTIVGERAVVMPGVVIKPQCRIGDDCVIHPGVMLYEYTELGDRVVLHCGTIIGAHGFGYRQQEGRHVPTAQLGYVCIESDVEVGANVTIDRGTYGATRIGEGTKIDNQVQIAHNCRIGKHNLLCSQVGIAGSCTTGDYVIMAGKVGVADHIRIGDKAILCAQAGIMHDCEAGGVYIGSPAMKQREQMQIFAVQRRLPEMRKELKSVRRDVDALTQSVETANDDQRDEQDRNEQNRAA
ncbi:UDP-3-O-(3-hydroxymyristoyl)glucosamine N-acyltransferase [Planctomycetes bacterium K23_9]|uniref:UDP-3-O-acylglucosamine N-acyltransferase n=1 Tax=Stieleria marina TaxID=1930275 RepID=A0A517P2P8_9BACT|nr:UDP-3-O-acylglucosamine N-acyltransferase [Planctomycetes bacterium K23_9]